MEITIKRKKENHYILCDNKKIQVEGRIVKIEGLEEFNFSLHNHKNNICVTELKTGLNVVKGSKQKEVIESLKEAINHYGIEEIKKLILETLDIDQRIKKINENEKLFIELEKVLGFSLPKCFITKLMTGDSKIDVFVLEKMLNVQENQSIEEVLVKKHGEEITKKIKSLI